MSDRLTPQAEAVLAMIRRREDPALIRRAFDQLTETEQEELRVVVFEMWDALKVVIEDVVGYTRKFMNQMARVFDDTWKDLSHEERMATLGEIFGDETGGDDEGNIKRR